MVWGGSFYFGTFFDKEVLMAEIQQNSDHWMLKAPPDENCVGGVFNMSLRHFCEDGENI